MILSSRTAQVVLAFVAASGFGLSAQTPAAAQAPPPPGQAARPAGAAPRRSFGGAGGDYKEYPQEVLDNGQKVYSANCAFCHGGNAKGGETGPDLLRSVIVLHDENGEGVGSFIRVGRPEKGMPKFNLPEAQVADIAAFLHDRVRAAAQRGGYQILNIVVGDPKAGEAYFNGAGRCATCHSATGDLAHVGSQSDAVAVQQKFLMPREGGRRGPGAGAAPNLKTAIMVSVTLPSGDKSEGRLEHIDDFSVSLVDKDGKSQKFDRDGDVPRVEVHDPLQPHLDLLAKYSDSDIHNLTAYLVTLK